MAARAAAETESLRRALATAKREKSMLATAKHDELMRRGDLSNTRGAYAEARAHFQAAFAVETRAESFVAAAAQHGQKPPSQCPSRLPRLFRARLAALGGVVLPEGEARLLGAQPPPRVLERAASKVAKSTNIDSPGRHGGQYSYAQ